MGSGRILPMEIWVLATERVAGLGDGTRTVSAPT